MERHPRNGNHLSVIITLVITFLPLYAAATPSYLFVDTFDGLAWAFAFTLAVPSAPRSLSLTSSFIHT